MEVTAATVPTIQMDQTVSDAWTTTTEILLASAVFPAAATLSVSNSHTAGPRWKMHKKPSIFYFFKFFCCVYNHKQYHKTQKTDLNTTLNIQIQQRQMYNTCDFNILFWCKV